MLLEHCDLLQLLWARQREVLLEHCDLLLLLWGLWTSWTLRGVGGRV